MTELIRLFDVMISLLISYGKWMIIYFNLPFKGKKGCVIKEAMTNKKKMGIDPDFGAIL